MTVRSAAAMFACTALLVVQALVPFCTATAGGGMPCCRTDSPCATAGIKAPGCCNIEPTPEKPRAPSALPADGNATGRGPAAVPAADPPAGTAPPPIGWADAPSGESRGAPVPLFLLHASLLC